MSELKKKPASDVDPLANINADVRQALDICRGDAMDALRMVIVANAFLEAEVARLNAATSAGYTRRQVTKPKKEDKDVV